MIDFNDIIWDDLTVESMYIDFEKGNLEISFLNYNELNDCYDKYKIIATEIINAKLGQIEIGNETGEVEITDASFCVIKNDEHKLSLTLLLGFGKPSVDIEVHAKNIVFLKV